MLLSPAAERLRAAWHTPRPLRLALVPAGVALGVAAEWISYDSTGFALTAADFAVGCVLIGCGSIAWELRRQSRVGGLMLLAGFAWFLGSFAQPVLLYLHRGPLVQLHLSYPTGRVRGRLAGAAIVLAYVAAAIEPLARNDALTLAVAAMVALAAIDLFARSGGPARKAGMPALAAALAFASVLAFGAAERLAGLQTDRAALWAYDVVIASVAIALLVDLLRGRWAEAVVTGLVVELGAPDEVGTLRAKLARALGDPSLVVGYRLPETSNFVDDAGRPVELPAPGSGRVVTALEDGGERVAVLVHDEGLLADRKLVESVAAAARVAVANARLQAEARARAAELEASRRRIVEAADAQRRRLEQKLRGGAERRLEGVAALLAQARATAGAGDAGGIAALASELEDARHELEQFSQGIHPRALTEGGLMAALELLAQRSSLPVALTGQVGRLPETVEAALYFVCSEALANAAKHAAASRVTIEVREEPDRAVVSVADDGVGGANASPGSGLRGLADRTEALGGSLRIESPPRAGTRLIAEIPTERASET